MICLFFSLSEKCKEVGTTLALCLLIRIIPYYLVWVLFGTAIPTSILQFISIILVCVHFFFSQKPAMDSMSSSSEVVFISLL